ncbi:MAG: protein kinase, partial [Terracidiphilus sp.]
PDNILVLADGTPRLLDFGTAKLVSPSASEGELTRSGYLSYTPQYASPEQVLGKPIAAASDTYSLGVLLYLLLTGKLPYQLEGLTTAEIQHVICEQAPSRPSLPSGKRLDSDLEAILLKALRKEPQQRYATVEQFAKDLRDFLDGNPVAARKGSWRYRAGKFVRRHRFALVASSVLAMTVIAGIIGIAWQRQKAEARADDLRQLSNSLLSELDGAIQQLPGSTNAQKILVTRVLDQLDRMNAAAQGDRATQLDLMQAYTRLSALQGSSYDQNIGDQQGALATIGKAIAMGEALTRSHPRDKAALRALAKAQYVRGNVLTGFAPMQESVAATQESIDTYNRLLALSGVTSEDLRATARAWAVLGDELGVEDQNSIVDLNPSFHAYRQMKALLDRALILDPNGIAREGFAAYFLRIAELDGFSDPVQELEDTREGLQVIDALPFEEQQSLYCIRSRMYLLTRQIDALTQLGRYTEARAPASRAVSEASARAAADPQDQRAQTDLARVLGSLAEPYEAAADSELERSAEARHLNLTAAEPALLREIAVLKSMQQSSSWQDLRPMMADVQIRLGIVQYRLRKDPAAGGLVASGLTTFRQICAGNQCSVMMLLAAAPDFLNAEPPSARDPELALTYAQRAVELTHHKISIMLLTLARAYRANGQIDQSRATARESLALLPPTPPHEAPSNMRRLLEKQTR